MKNTSSTAIIILAFCAFGCGTLDRFKSNTGTNQNRSETAAPTVSATATPTPEAKSDEAKDQTAELGRNYLAFTAGTKIASVSSESKNSSTGVRHLIDEAGFGWETEDGAVENQTVVLELPARTTFKAFAFDVMSYNQYEKFAPVKDFSIEVSDVSPTAGFQTIVEGTFNEGGRSDDPPQVFPAAKQIPARFVRYTAKNSYGEGKRIFTEELRGYGEQEPIATIQNITGSYELYGGGGVMSGEYLQIKQDGASIIGCIGTNEYTRIVEGGVEGRIVTLKYHYWNESDKDSGAMIFAPDGQNADFVYWRGEGKKSYDSVTPARKKSDKPGSCAKIAGFDNGGQDTVKDNLEKELAENGKAILYGINFDFNSDVIKPESRPTLDKVIAILKEKPDWKFSVEGHTDNIGGDAFNQTLSEKRAASVVKYLGGAGIDQSRLSSKGYGLSKPLAPNDSEAERAQNRRVELVKQ